MQLQDAQKEIEDLHQFFQSWFNGECPQTKIEFLRLEGVLAESFTIIPPSGTTVDRKSLLTAIFNKHGTYASPTRKIKIWIENVRIHHQDDNYAVVTYDEWQTRETTTSRKSTVIFQTNKHAPNGIEWLHLHETWVE